MVRSARRYDGGGPLATPLALFACIIASCCPAAPFPARQNSRAIITRSSQTNILFRKLYLYTFSLAPNTTHVRFELDGTPLADVGDSTRTTPRCGRCICRHTCTGLLVVTFGTCWRLFETFDQVQDLR